MVVLPLGLNVCRERKGKERQELLIVNFVLLVRPKL